MIRFINVLAILILVCTSSSLAQTKEFKGFLIPYPQANGNLVLLNRDLLRTNSGDLALEFSMVDNSFQEVWKNYYPFSKGLTPVLRKVNEDGILLLFTDRRRQQYELILANLEDGSYQRNAYVFTDPFEVSEVDFYYDNIWAAGAIDNNPTVFKLLPDNTYNALPVGLPGNLKYAGSLQFNKSRKAVDYLILGEVDSKDVIVWRSISLDGEIIVNKKLDQFQNREVRSIKGKFSDNRAIVTGLYGMANKPKDLGLYFGSFSERSKLSLKPFKDIPGVSAYKRIKDIESKGYSNAKETKYKLPNRQIYTDNIVFDKEGAWIAFETYGAQFRNRGTLEQQFIARDRRAQLDLNTYGLRDGLDGSTISDRIDNYSATDQMQFNFMGQSLAKAISEGLSYNHTSMIFVSNAGVVKDQPGLWFNIEDSGALAQSEQLNDSGLAYSFENRFFDFDYRKREVKVIDTEENTTLTSWTKEALLGVEFVNESKTTRLSKVSFR